MVWSAIGGAIGGAISPTEIEGPRIGDGQNQSSAEGVPIAWIQGTAGFVQGNIVDKGPRREVKKEDDGKGSSTVAVTYEAHQDFTIMICESSETRDSLMTGVLIVRVNGKIVYDMREESNFAAENAKFLENHTFYDGNEAQLTDPTEEAWPTNGVGNTPYYRGVYRMVARDINLSQYGDAIPTYEFVMVGEGDAVQASVETLATVTYPIFLDAEFPLGSPEDQYLITDVSRQDAGTIPGPFNTIADALDAVASYEVFGTGFQYLAYTQDDADWSTITPQATVVDNTILRLLFSDVVPNVWIDAPYTDQAAVESAYTGVEGTAYADEQGFVFFLYPSSSAPPLLPNMQIIYFINFLGSGDLWEGHMIFYTTVLITREPISPEYTLGDPCLMGVPALLPDAPGFVIDCGGNIFPAATFSTPPVGTYAILREEHREGVPGASGWEIITEYAQGPILPVGDPDNNQAFWEAAAAEAGIPGTWPVDFPELVSEQDIWLATAETNSLSSNLVLRSTGIERICIRGGLTEEDLNLTDVTGTFMGYPVKESYDAANTLRPLLFAWKMYGSEYDGVLNFHYHGADVEIVIDPQDIIDTGEVNDRNTREQEIEYPRKIGVGYIDPEQNYEARPQWAYRLSTTINAIGEEATQTSVVMTAEEAAQLADVSLKVQWARLQGFRELALPFVQFDTYLQLVPGMPVGLDQKRWIVSELMMEEGELQFKLSYDRQSAFFSSVSGVPALPPTPPPSNIGGVTLFAAMNLPRLRTKDNTPGMYLAVAGILPAWPGALLQMSTDGGSTWTTALPSMTQASTMGYLNESITDASSETISVSVHGGQLSSITFDQLVTGGNPSAIITNGVSEVLQFQTATELEQGEYELTNLIRGGLGTIPAVHAAGDRFVQLEDVYFLPLDITLAGRTLHFRPVTFGTLPENNATYSAVFSPLFTGPQVIDPYVNQSNEIYVNEIGSTYFRIEP